MIKTPSIDLTPQEFRAQLDSTHGAVIDCRTAGECVTGAWPGAQQLDWLNGEVHKAIDLLDKAKTYFIYCRSGVRSAQAARFMKANGFADVYNVGGYDAIMNQAE
ncbi:MAG: hypothetical protein CL845_09050 [Crocinitomicaceae bacterium]|nr:hypothetical protein [Crocinitomicaceae bacterium]HBP45093.1 hypothetical protein [Flavobacteriales bacterium]|tara:strand:- start:181 stop:495 length:315 start_codon:yes stop_codon:yes gene_type:complete